MEIDFLQGHVHIDDWLDEPKETEAEKYAAFVLELFRMPAYKMINARKHIEQFKLFAHYKGAFWRVIGASRMGDVWITMNHETTRPYQERVFVDELSDWRPSLADSDTAPNAVTVETPPEKIEVTASALRSLLMALLGPAHAIREYQVLMKTPLLNADNPICILKDEFNAWAKRTHEGE